MKVCIIGAGVIGLSSALNIIDSFPNIDVTVISEHFTPNTTGDGAVGTWPPHKPGRTPTDLICKWSSATFEHFLSISKHEEADIAGVELISGHYVFPKKVEDPIWKNICIGFRHMTQREIDAIAPHAKHGWFFISIVCTCIMYLPWLQNKIRKKHGIFVQRKIESFEELSGHYDVVVNCTGIGSCILESDPDLIPYQGQHVTIKGSAQKMFLVDRTTRSTNVGSTTIFPRRDYVIIGGTSSPGEWSTVPSIETRDDIIRRANKLAPSLKNGVVVNVWAGLRPVRSSGVRLEREIKRFGSRKLHVIHNYGHGGGGIGLHWGCAIDTARLVGECLQELLSSKL